MEQRLAEYDGTVFVCGIALNIDQFLGIFERIFLYRSMLRRRKRV